MACDNHSGDHGKHNQRNHHAPIAASHQQ